MTALPRIAALQRQVRTVDLIRGLVNHPPDGSQLDDSGLDELWRPDPAFVGPVEPAMVAWLRMGSPPSAWQVAAAGRRAAVEPRAGEQFAFDFGRAVARMTERERGRADLFEGASA